MPRAGYAGATERNGARMRARHREVHRSNRVGWLRAAVLGANDGIVSVAGLVVGVAASGASHTTVLMSGVAGLVAGAMSMAAGEYVSVQSQADTEKADLRQEKQELADDPHTELAELAHIYVRRGLTPALAHQVAEQLTAHDALGRARARRAGHHRHFARAPGAGGHGFGGGFHRRCAGAARCGAAGAGTSMWAWRPSRSR